MRPWCSCTCLLRTWKRAWNGHVIRPSGHLAGLQSSKLKVLQLLACHCIAGHEQLTGLALEPTRSPQHVGWSVCRASCAPLVRQVGRLNPAELKAQKLARSGAGGGGDRNAKPDVDERRAIHAVLNYPPNRSCSQGRVVHPLQMHCTSMRLACGNL
jgi:hypothetical protein